MVKSCGHISLFPLIKGEFFQNVCKFNNRFESVLLYFILPIDEHEQ